MKFQEKQQQLDELEKRIFAAWLGFVPQVFGYGSFQ